MSNEMTTQDNNTSLTVNLNDQAVANLQNQRHQLRKFIASQLNDGSDYGIVPGTKKNSLYKPGAEKLANLFQLGSRIAKSEKTIDIKDNFAMFATTIEVFHLKTGTAISQCEGITNSQESKYKSRPVCDILNTLAKMAQKRAYVGAVIIAVGASDFFTQDMEDTEPTPPSNQPIKTVVVKPSVQNVASGQNVSDGYIISFGKYKGQSITADNYKQLAHYIEWGVESAQKEGKPLSKQWEDLISEYDTFIATNPNLGEEDNES